MVKESKNDFTQRWIANIDAALKREKDWRKDAEEFMTIYESDKESQFNIFYSNTETLHPAIYNQLPRPIVERKFRTEDPVARVCAELAQRFLEYSVDPGGYKPETDFDQEVQAAVLAGLVVGRGIHRVKYTATFQKVPNPQYEAMGFEGEEKFAEGVEPEIEVKEDEAVMLEAVPWDWFLHGYAKKWNQVPWIAFLHKMTPDEIGENFGEEARRAAKQARKEIEEPDKNPDEKVIGTSHGAEDKKDPNSPFDVWEIWDIKAKMVYFISQEVKDTPLDEKDDPLGLKGFYPIPQPFMPFHRVSGLLPVPLYKFYREQAKELAIITQRIERLTKSLRVRGFYDSSIAGLADVLTAEDDTLIPIQNAAQLATIGSTLDKAIIYVPLEVVIQVITQLTMQRDRIRQVIFEITGLSDIMRGVSYASETLGAQKIKDAWGTQRLRKMQRSVQYFLRDTLRLMLEVAVKFFDPERLNKMTDMQLLSMQEKQMQMQQLAGQLQQLQMQAQQGLQQFQAQGQQPPQELVQQVQGQMQQLQQQLQSLQQRPSIEEAVQLLSDDNERMWRIDVETGSTLDAEVVEDKQDLAEMFNAVAQFLNGISPFVQAGLMPFDGAKFLLLEMVRRFRFGKKAEEVLGAMQAPPPQQENQTENQAVQIQLQLQQQKAETDMKLLQMKGEQASADHQMKLQEMQIRLQEIQAKHGINTEKQQAQLTAIMLKAEAAQRQAAAQVILADKKIQEAQAQI